MNGGAFNKTLITLGFLLLIFGAIVGNILLALWRPDAIQTFNNSMVTILGVGTAAIVTIYGLGSQGEKLKRIETNTNGRLSEQLNENKRLTNIIIDAGLDPELEGQHRLAGLDTGVVGASPAADHRAEGPAS